VVHVNGCGTEVAGSDSAFAHMNNSGIGPGSARYPAATPRLWITHTADANFRHSTGMVAQPSLHTPLASTPNMPDSPAVLDIHRPFTRADAVAAGIDPQVLAGSRFRRIFRGVYISSGVPDDPCIRAAAALCFHPAGAYASHLTAARMYKLPVPKAGLEHVCVASARDRRHRAGVLSHVAPAQPTVVKVRGVRVSSALETFVALAEILDFVDLVAVGDAMTRLKLVTPPELVAKAKAAVGRSAARARRAAGLVRYGVDSPMETRLRLLIVLAGLPEPEVNHAVRDSQGNIVMRFDLSYPGLKLLIEYDGRQHAEDSLQWRRDLERRELLDRGDWRLLVVTAEGIFKEPARTLSRIRTALKERGCPTLPRRLRAEWTAHFPAE